MPTGLVSAYDLTVGVKVLMDELIYTYTPDDLPLLTGVTPSTPGSMAGLALLQTAPTDQIAYSWQDEELLVPRTTLAATLVTAGTTLTVASGDRNKFATGDLLQIRSASGVDSDEIIRVASYGVTTDTLVVTRTYNTLGTARQYPNAAVVIGIGTALAEGSDPQAFRSKDRTARSGNTQIFGPTKIHMSRTAQQVPRYGVPNEWDRQLRNRTYEDAQRVEQAYLYGTASSSTTAEIRMTGGLRYYISTNVNTSATQLSEANLLTQMQTAYNQGGVPDILMANPYSLTDLNDISNTSRVRVEVDDPRRGRTRVTQIITEFGDLTVVRNRFVHPYDAFCFRREQATRMIMQPLIFERLAKTGDADSAQIVREEGFKFTLEKRAFRFAGLSYTAV